MGAEGVGAGTRGSTLGCSSKSRFSLTVEPRKVDRSALLFADSSGDGEGLRCCNATLCSGCGKVFAIVRVLLLELSARAASSGPYLY